MADRPPRARQAKPRTGKPGPAARPHTAAAGGKPPRAPDPFVYGWHPVQAALLNPDRPVHAVFCTETAQPQIAGAIVAAKAAGLPRPDPQILPRQRLDRMLPPGAVHQGVAVEVGPLPPTDLDDLGRAATVRPPPVIVIALDHVTDPHNVGAVVRSAATFGAIGVVVTDRHAPEVTGVLARSASGGVERVPIVRVVNLAAALETLRSWQFRIVGLDERAGSTLQHLPPGPRTVLVLGAEGDGLREKTQATCDVLVRLPTVGDFASLNVSNAAAIGLYELVRSSGGSE